ncbi:MAG: carbohydrate-binding domain-containing protein [Oscillospiraceae bacterium]|nr:carbohydrate-binding domain-containing protein [Oscillospiraceae bacterium]
MKKIIALALASALCLSLIACTPKESASTQDSGQSETAADNTNETEKTADTADTADTSDKAEEKTVDTGTQITLDGDSVELTEGGTYTVSGTLSDGQIKVDTGEQEVTLVLNGVDITCSDDNAIEIKSTGKVTIIAQDGSENTVTTPAGTDSYAAISSDGDLTLSGSGKLTVAAASGTGIHCEGVLTVDGGVYEVYSENNGLKGDSGVNISDGTFTVVCAGDGIKTDSTTQGSITITGGTFNITAGDDAIQSEGDMDISGGDFTLTTNGGSSNAPVRERDGMGGPFGGGMYSSGSDSSDEDISAKGVKAEGTLNISGGTFNIDAYDDGLHAANITIADGTFNIASGDDGVHSDGNLDIKGGSITVTYCNEGLEGAIITVDDGEIDITSYDDGINAAGGSEITLIINGGTVKVDAAGDGLDSNGDMYINGGYVEVSGSENNGNAALDYASESGGTLIINGGTVVATGMSGMAEGVSSQSAQNNALVCFSGVLSAGDKVIVSDSNGNTVMEFTVTKSCNAVYISSPDLESGQTYTVTGGGESIDVTFTSTVVTAGTASGGMMGGPGGFGGMGGPGMGGPGGR